MGKYLTVFVYLGVIISSWTGIFPQQKYCTNNQWGQYDYRQNYQCCYKSCHDDWGLGSNLMTSTPSNNCPLTHSQAVSRLCLVFPFFVDIDFWDSPVALASRLVGGQFMAIYSSTILALRLSDWGVMSWVMGICRDIVYTMLSIQFKGLWRNLLSKRGRHLWPSFLRHFLTKIGSFCSSERKLLTNLEWDETDSTTENIKYFWLEQNDFYFKRTFVLF